MLLSFLILVSFFWFLVPPASAQCPVCVVTVGGGMLLAQKLGIDDLLVSVWISALNTVIAFWLAPKIRPKNKLFRFISNPVILSFLLLITTLFYFYFTDQIGVTSNRILGVDKILLGNILGFLAILVGNHLYLLAKRRNHNKAIFPYSKVVFPFGLTLLITLVLKFAFNL